MQRAPAADKKPKKHFLDLATLVLPSDVHLLISNLSLPLAMLCAVSFLLSRTPPFPRTFSVFGIADHLHTL